MIGQTKFTYLSLTEAIEKQTIATEEDHGNKKKLRL